MDGAIELWRGVPGLDGVMVSNWGHFIGRRGRLLTRAPHHAGYRYMVVHINTKRTSLSHHGMVAAAFLGPRPDGLVIDHIDRNKLNNAVENLRYCTSAENARNSNRADELARQPPRPRKVTSRPPAPPGGRAGAANGRARLSEQQVLEILALTRPTNRRPHKTGPTVADIAKRYGVGRTTIADIFSAKKWRHLHVAPADGAS